MNGKGAMLPRFQRLRSWQRLAGNESPVRILGAISVSHVVVPVTAVAAAGLALFVSAKILQEPPATVSVAPQQAQVQHEAALTAAQRQAKDQVKDQIKDQIKDLAVALAPSPRAAGGTVPEFDIVHIEPTGEAVVAGRAAPGATVELLLNGE